MTDELKKEEAKEVVEEKAASTEVAAEESKAPKAKEEKKSASNQKKYTRTAKGKKRAIQSVPRGRAYIKASLNNTIITITDQNGNTVAWASAGGAGFRGPKKATPYAASKVVDMIGEKLEALGTKELQVFVTGIGSGKDSAIRSLNSKGVNISGIKELTPVPHNGCRPRRARRV